MRLVEHAVREQAAGEAGVALHRVEVAVAVAAAERDAGDEVVEDEVVEDDDARARARSASTIQPCASGSLPTW